MLLFLCEECERFALAAAPGSVMVEKKTKSTPELEKVAKSKRKSVHKYLLGYLRTRLSWLSPLAVSR